MDSLLPLAEVTATLACLTPALAVWLCFERGAFVVSKRTSIITFSGLVELGMLCVLLLAGAWLSVAGAITALIGSLERRYFSKIETSDWAIEKVAAYRVLSRICYRGSEGHY